MAEEKKKEKKVVERVYLLPVYVDAFDLDDAWRSCISEILDKGCEYTITRGSYAGQKRLELDFVTIRIKEPGTRPLTPRMPEGLNIPPPTSDEYVEQDYLPYLLSAEKKKGEDYTYGERLIDPKIRLEELIDKENAKKEEKEISLNVNQIEEVIKMYKTGRGTNQATMEIAMPSDIKLNDPPCLRLIDTRVRYEKLHFIVYFRSWDLWGGFPANLAGLQLVKEYMADEIGVKDGEMIALSKGLHLYDHYWEWAKSLSRKEMKGVKD